MRFPYIIRSTRCFPEHRIKRRGIEIENGRRRIAFSLFFVVAAGLLLTAAAAAAADFPSSSFSSSDVCMCWRSGIFQHIAEY